MHIFCHSLALSTCRLQGTCHWYISMFVTFVAFQQHTCKTDRMHIDIFFCCFCWCCAIFWYEQLKCTLSHLIHNLSHRVPLFDILNMSFLWNLYVSLSFECVYINVCVLCIQSFIIHFQENFFLFIYLPHLVAEIGRCELSVSLRSLCYCVQLMVLFLLTDNIVAKINLLRLPLHILYTDDYDDDDDD